MFLKDQSKTLWGTRVNENVLYVTSIEMVSGMFIPGPIRLVLSILRKQSPSVFDRYTDLFLGELDRYVTRPSESPNINICVDFGEYDIKRK